MTQTNFKIHGLNVVILLTSSMKKLIFRNLFLGTILAVILCVLASKWKWIQTQDLLSCAFRTDPQFSSWKDLCFIKTWLIEWFSDSLISYFLSELWPYNRSIILLPHCLFRQWLCRQHFCMKEPHKTDFWTDFWGSMMYNKTVSLGDKQADI